jgi:hypothetical protein
MALPIFSPSILEIIEVFDAAAKSVKAEINGVDINACLSDMEGGWPPKTVVNGVVCVITNNGKRMAKFAFNQDNFREVAASVTVGFIPLGKAAKGLRND